MQMQSMQAGCQLVIHVLALYCPVGYDADFGMPSTTCTSSYFSIPADEHHCLCEQPPCCDLDFLLPCWHGCGSIDNYTTEYCYVTPQPSWYPRLYCACITTVSMLVTIAASYFPSVPVLHSRSPAARSVAREMFCNGDGTT